MIGMMMAALAMVVSAPVEQQAEPALPDWMAGCWEQRDGERWTEECWMAPRAGIMLGASRSGRGDTLGSWEAMQIVLAQPAGEEPRAPMAFWATPGGTHRAMFTWQPDSEPGVTFVNRTNDYPQRVRYWREGKALMAEIALADGSKPMRWRYCPVGSSGRAGPSCGPDILPPK